MCLASSMSSFPSNRSLKGVIPSVNTCIGGVSFLERILGSLMICESSDSIGWGVNGLNESISASVTLSELFLALLNVWETQRSSSIGGVTWG